MPVDSEQPDGLLPDSVHSVETQDVLLLLHHLEHHHHRETPERKARRETITT